MKDDKHESKEFLNTMAMRDFLHHITASTRFTRSNEKQEGRETTFQSGWATFLSRTCRSSRLHSFISETECREEQITRFAQLKRSLAKRLGTTSPSACDQRFNTQVTHYVSQIQMFKWAARWTDTESPGCCNVFVHLCEKSRDAASRDAEVRIWRRLVFFWDKPRGGTKKKKKSAMVFGAVSVSASPSVYKSLFHPVSMNNMLLRVTAVPKLPPLKKHLLFLHLSLRRC